MEKETEKIDFNALIQTEPYDFLRNNEHLGDNVILLALGGSHAYGTNRASSDVDIRGIVLNSARELIGYETFDEYRNRELDVVIYSFNKMINLLCNCNPNVIEIVGCKPEHYLHINPIGQRILDSKEMFISKRAANSFGGFALSQLRRLENALTDKAPTQEEKEKYILGSIERYTYTWNEQFKPIDGKINFFIDKSEKTDLDKEIFINLKLDKYPLRDMHAMIKGMTDIVRNYDKLNNENKKKDDFHVNKHAMHLVRSLLMGTEILETGIVNTYREKDLPLLKSILNGDFMNDDGTYKNSFRELINGLEEKFSIAKEKCTLPDTPDMKKVEEFVMEVNSEIIKKYKVEK